MGDSNLLVLGCGLGLTLAGCGARTSVVVGAGDAAPDVSLHEAGGDRGLDGGPPEATFDAGDETAPMHDATPDAVETGCPTGLVTLAESTDDKIVATGCLAIDDESVYWTAFDHFGENLNGSVLRVSKCGGPTVTLASNQPFPVNVVVDESNVYWLGGAGASTAVVKVAKVGGTVTTLAASPGEQYGGLALVGPNLYWTSIAPIGMFSGGADVLSVPVTGGNPKTIASLSDTTVYTVGSPPYQYIAADSANLYWLNNAYAVMKVPLAGGTPATLAVTPEISASRGIATDGVNVYWAQTVRDDTFGFVTRVPVQGGTITTVATNLVDPTNVALDADYVYWTDPGQETVEKVSLSGGTPTTLADRQNTYPSPGVGMAVDATSVYWVGSDNIHQTKIMRLTQK